MSKDIIGHEGFESALHIRSICLGRILNLSEVEDSAQYATALSGNRDVLPCSGGPTI
jgi:hypothetical protein